MSTVDELRKNAETLLNRRVPRNKALIYDDAMSGLSKWLANDAAFMMKPNVQRCLFPFSGEIYSWSIEKFAADRLSGIQDMTWLQLAQQSQSIHFISAATLRANNRQHLSAFVSLDYFGILLCRTVVLGWQEDAELFARVGFNDVAGVLNDGVGPRQNLPWFIAELFKDWLGAKEVNLDTPFRTEFFDDLGPWQKLFDNWREADPAQFGKIVFEAAETHVVQSHEAELGKKEKRFDVEKAAYWIWPISLLAVLRLREWEGLSNPTMTHPLFLNNPFCALKAPIKREPNALLEAAQERFARENPGVATISDLPRLRKAQGSGPEA